MPILARRRLDFDQAMRDSVLRRHFDCLEKEEVLPGIAIDLPFDRHAYCERIAERFANRAIADALERICMDGFAIPDLPAPDT